LLLSAAWAGTRLDEDPSNDLHLHERALFYYSMGAALLGAQFLSVGLLAELFTAHLGHDVLPYSIQQVVGNRNSGPVEPAPLMPWVPPNDPLEKV
jgi:hypothetical protein